jgi:hypothetical protein
MGLSKKGDFKPFTPFTIYCRGGKVANLGFLKQPHIIKAGCGHINSYLSVRANPSPKE